MSPDVFPLREPKPALSLLQMSPKEKGERAAERSAIRSNRLPIPYVYMLYIQVQSLLVLEGHYPEAPFPHQAVGLASPGES